MKWTRSSLPGRTAATVGKETRFTHSRHLKSRLQLEEIEGAIFQSRQNRLLIAPCYGRKQEDPSIGVESRPRDFFKERLVQNTKAYC